MVDFTRKITHQRYKNPEKLKKYYHRVEKKIHIKPSKFDKGYVERKRSDYILYNDEFLATKIPYYIVPLLGGGVSLILFLGTLKYSLRDGVTNENLFFCYITVFCCFWVNDAKKRTNIKS
ncbi:hypothetical protein Q4517_11700 [Tenacibaculum sp. 1_MG-2023]|uniref:hypothetical protein n=1 Tax=Tenacibaculum sp. 1_MG-2023 TaxID=3062653 RepID=UPI0026E2AD18|nr:hypothetical protein [Tenacibaculum sp. 1_MG-2023]MDO6676209.1 hypothetical protein [Tenacibaculum sp. 1_MG-2023]